jgi:hypothetical protein
MQPIFGELLLFWSQGMRQHTRSMSTGLTIFAVFFGIALLDAFKLGHWWTALFWVAMGSFFVALEARGRQRTR